MGLINEGFQWIVLGWLFWSVIQLTNGIGSSNNSIRDLMDIIKKQQKR